MPANQQQQQLPVPAQLEAQLGKCKTVRQADTYIKDRTKTAKVSNNVVLKGESERVTHPKK
jgi:hypothetical protein